VTAVDQDQLKSLRIVRGRCCNGHASYLEERDAWRRPLRRCPISSFQWGGNAWICLSY
jgi:hypothetical protein